MVDKYGTAVDPYTYKGTSTLINKLGIRDAKILAQAEQEFTELAASEIVFNDPPYNFQTLCDLHKLLFEDLYDWAGKIRTIDISKGSTRFCACEFVEREANKIFKRLEKENYLTGLGNTQFVKKLAEYYCDINALHPFREGNGRVQRILFEHICINSGFNLSLSGVSVEEWVDANIRGFHGDYACTENIFSRSLSVINL